MDLNGIYEIKELSNFQRVCPQTGIVKNPHTRYGYIFYYYVEFATVWVTFIVDRLFLPSREVTKNVTVFRVKLDEEESTMGWKLLHNGNYLTSFIDYKNNTPNDLNELEEWERVKELYLYNLREMK